MSCSFDKNILSRFARGKIEPLEKVFLEEHIKKCSECKSYLENERIIAKSEKKDLRKSKVEKKSVQKEDIVIIDTEKKSKTGLDILGIAGIASIAGIVIKGSTAWLRIVPFKEIAKNIFKRRKAS